MTRRVRTCLVARTAGSTISDIPLGECPRCLAEESAEPQREHFERQEQEEARECEEERELEQQRRHEELVQLHEREIYERNNPGDYKCPECLLVSLKRELDLRNRHRPPDRLPGFLRREQQRRGFRWINPSAIAISKICFRSQRR